MRFTLTIDSDGDALAEDPAGEVARLLRKAAEHVQNGREEFPLLDVNGNTVGTGRLTP